MSKILLLDAETAPTMAYVWGLWKQNIGLDQILDRGYLMSCTCKWLGEKEVYYIENKTHNDYRITKTILDYLNEADNVVAHNGKKFDIPFIKARAVVHSIPPPSPFKIIDTLEIAKKEFLFSSNKLEALAKELGCTPKGKHNDFSGFKMWSECLQGNYKAWEAMKEYNIQDVLTLEEVYLKMRPYASQHPNVTVEDDLEPMFRCPKCGSDNVHLRGYTHTNVGKYHKYVCLDCGSWSRERYTSNSLETRKTLLKSQ